MITHPEMWWKFKGVKIDAQLPRSERFASIMRSGVLLRPPVSAGVLEPLKKMGRTPGLKKVKELVCSKRDHSHFCNGSNNACACRRRQKERNYA